MTEAYIEFASKCVMDTSVHVSHLMKMVCKCCLDFAKSVRENWFPCDEGNDFLLSYRKLKVNQLGKSTPVSWV